MKLSPEHLEIANRYGLTEVVEDVIQTYDRYPIAMLLQIGNPEAHMVVALRKYSLIKEMLNAGYNYTSRHSSFSSNASAD